VSQQRPTLSVAHLVSATRRHVEREVPGALVGTDVDGRQTTVALSPEASSLLLFLGTSCAGCEELWRALSDQSAFGLAPRDRVIALVRAADDAPVSPVSGAGAAALVAPSVWEQFSVVGPPFGVLVTGDPPTVIAECVPLGLEHLRHVVRTTLEDRTGLETP
jgi:hypothetical protein